MKQYEKYLAIALETVGASVVAAGIAIEVATGAEIGYIIISGGCLVGFVGAMFYAKVFRGSRF